jgi:selT/selW/selH-like putative selenoprotein
VDTEISVGRTGDFEVTLDGRPVFSKAGLNRFPNPGEVENLIEEFIKGN